MKAMQRLSAQVVCLLLVVVGWAASPASAAHARPVITAVSPAVGPLSGGDTLRVDGRGFKALRSVTFGGVQATVVSRTATSIMVVAPPTDRAGIVPVRVRTRAGVSRVSSRTTYTYAAPPAISSLSAVSGHPVGGQELTVNGDHLESTQSVTFGDFPAMIVAVHRNSVTVTVPSMPPGAWTVGVLTAGGQALGPEFTVTAPEAGEALEVQEGEGTFHQESSDVVGVVEPDAEEAGQQVVLAADAARPPLGDPYFLPPSEAVPQGAAGLVEAVTQQADGTVIVSLDDAPLDSVVDEYAASFSGALTDDSAVDISEEGGERAASRREATALGTVSFGKVPVSRLKCVDPQGKPASISGSVDLQLQNTRIHTDINAGRFVLKPHVAMWASWEAVVTGSITAKLKVSCTIPTSLQNTLKKVIPLGATGLTFSVAPDIKLSVSASGTVSVSQRSYRMTGFISNPDGTIRQLDGKSADPAQVQASGSLQVRADVGLEIQLGVVDRIGVGGSVGLFAAANATVTSTSPPQICADISAGLSASVYAYLDVWVTKWKVQFWSAQVSLVGFRQCWPIAGDPAGFTAYYRPPSADFPYYHLGVDYEHDCTKYGNQYYEQIARVTYTDSYSDTWHVEDPWRMPVAGNCRRGMGSGYDSPPAEEIRTCFATRSAPVAASGPGNWTPWRAICVSRRGDRAVTSAPPSFPPA